MFTDRGGGEPGAAGEFSSALPGTRGDNAQQHTLAGANELVECAVAQRSGYERTVGW